MMGTRKHLAKRWETPNGVILRCACGAWESGRVGTIQSKRDAHRAHRTEMGDVVPPRKEPRNKRLAAEVERLQAQVQELQSVLSAARPADTMIEMNDGKADMTAKKDSGEILIKVRGATTWYEFPGELLTSVTKDNPGAVQWTDINLYRFTDDTGRYFLQSIGRSRVYHRMDGTCKRGIPVEVGDLDDDFYDTASPCPLPGCRPEPLDVLDDDVEVRQERDLYTTWECATPEDIVQSLREQSQRGRRSDARRPATKDMPIGMPGMRLLQQAAAKDQRIAESMLTTVRL